jgi:protease I
MAKIATLITNMFEDSEYMDPATAFNNAGHEVFTIEKEAGNRESLKLLENL